MKLPKKGILSEIDRKIWPLLHGNKAKVFCIGMNKTGTTSLKAALVEFGYRMGNQPNAERLLPNYLKEDYEPIIKYCKSANAFQDIPFSYTGMYKELDKSFPGSKFILTVRDDAEQWYTSLTRFHAKVFGLEENRPPTASELKEKVDYRGKNWFYNSIVNVFGTDDSDPYNEQILKKYYNNHAQSIETYFENRSQDFLKINIKDASSYHKLARFLNKEPLREQFVWKNKT